MSTTTVSGLRDSTPLSGPSAASSDMNAEFYTTSTIVDAVNEFIRTAPPASISKTPLTQEHLETTTTTMSTMFGAPTSSLTPHKVNVADLSHSLQHFGIVDYVVFVLMLVVCAVIGFYFGFIEKKKKKKKGNRDNEERRGSEALDYLVGGRKMKVFPVSLSLVASFISGISLLGTSTEIYVYGTQYAFILFTLVISGVISWYIFLPVFCNLQLTSTYEYFEKRFDRRVRYFGSIVSVIFVNLWMPIAIYVPAITFNMVTGIDLNIVTPILCLVCTGYTCIGGIKGVIWTDVLQGFIMVATLAFVVVKGTLDVGGLGVVYQRNFDSGRIVAPDWTLDPTVRMGFFSVFIGGTIFKLQGICISQPAAQRFFSLPDMKAVRNTLTLFIFGLAFLLGLCIYIGLLAYAQYYDCDPMTTGLARAKDQIVPLFVMEIAGSYPGIPGLFVSGVLSAALSSLSTALNSLSAVVLTDFIEPNRKTPLTERQTAIALRGIVLFSGISSLAMVHVVKHLGLVMQLSSTFGSLASGPVLGIFTVGILLPFVNAKSVFSGCIASTAILSYILIRSQIDIATGVLKFPTKPVSIDGCDYEFNLPKTANTTFNDLQGTLPTRSIHHLSFLCYALFGAVITILVSLLATLYFGKENTSEMDPNLVATFLRRFLNTKTYIPVNDKLHIDKQDLKEGGYLVLNKFEKEHECEQ